MRKWLSILFLLLLIIAGCSWTGSAGEKGSDSAAGGDSTEEQEESIKLDVDGTTYIIEQDNFPILWQFIHSSGNTEAAIEGLHYQEVTEDRYLIDFACREDVCSHLLISFEDEVSYLLSDLSERESIELSPEGGYAAFLFSRDVNGEKKHQMTVVDMASLNPMELETADEYLLPRPDQYQYAIDSVTFMEETLIQMKSESIPEEPGRESVTSLWKYGKE
ncbi:UNVERIFIED_CONTAM: hypothetical protein N8J90_01365 [Halobacillus marinus]|uniref:hypothetical protein n=1 Tax=Halobacillus sp. BAB-2008 TaxID=1246484 RepID=UPI0002A4D406|nr:hypothetical protein [Halobacillus sp. BAB-2008]ELK45433.1 hypothetical protein D479_14972 [Halobacillus sp. BAB-2008]